MNNTSVWAFLTELVQRLGAKNPKFFNILALVGAIASVITGLPGVLIELGINLPDAWDVLANKIVAWAGIVVIIMSNLAVQRPVVSATKTGDNTVKTNADTLPFTAAVEKKEVEKSKE